MRIEALARDHQVASFDCGDAELNSWLTKVALGAHRGGTARVFILLDAEEVVGFYVLTVASVAKANLPARVTKGAPDPVPFALIGRLAIDLRWQRKGVGAALLSDAVKRIVGLSSEVGIRGVLVHTASPELAHWYAHQGFKPSPTDPLQMVVLLKDARQAVNKLSAGGRS